jgi:branched-chain amino acid transport system permease protein
MDATLKPTMTASVPAAVATVENARVRQIIVAAVVFGAIATAPFFVKDVYTLNILILFLLYGAMSQAWNILGGYCGQISLGNALYFGIGAYATTVAFVTYGVSPWIGLVAGGVLSAAVALALGWPCFRLKGHYFSIATIVIAEIGLLLVHNWEFVGGALGMQWTSGERSWLMLQFGRDKVPFFYLMLALAVITWAATYIVEDTRAGFWWRAVKDNPQAAESLGVDVFRSKMTAAALSALFTAAGGGLYAAFVAYIDPESVMSFRFSLLFALPAVLGGLGMLWGPLLGAAILIPLTEVTRSYMGGSGSGIDLIIYGALIIGVALFKPEGLLSFFGGLGQRKAAS